MPVDTIDPDFEANFLNQRLAQLHEAYPAEATLIANILAALDYQKTLIRNELQVRGMVIAGCSKFAKTGADQAAWAGLLQQFANQGALSADQAVELQRQAAAIRA